MRVINAKKVKTIRESAASKYDQDCRYDPYGRRARPDYNTGIVGKCLGPTTSKGHTKDGCKIFRTSLAMARALLTI